MNKKAKLQLAVNEYLIHYGSNVFNPELILPIENNNWTKPCGGLWTSPINSNWGWKDWCERENFRECSKENSFTLKLYDWAKTCVINSVSDLKHLPYYSKSYGKINMRYLNFEKIAKKYDTIWLTEKGLEKTMWSNPNLYGWDCETVLILNPKCCYQVIF